MSFCVRIGPEGRTVTAFGGENLLELLRREGLAPESPCGGHGKCGKCRVTVDGEECLACRTTVERDMCVELPAKARDEILSDGVGTDFAPGQPGLLAAFDIGTTTVVGYLLDGMSGETLAVRGMKNPQAGFGADVISRIRAAQEGHLSELQNAIRGGMESLLRQLCAEAGRSPEEIRALCPVGNPAMQQLFMGIVPDNLAQIPFDPVLTGAKTVAAGEYLPMLENAKMYVVPDISGYVGADTVACLLATELEKRTDTALMLDIGTNGEMVLIHGGRMAACSAAAGPALEGANIRFGMRAQEGAIDRVWIENGALRCHAIGDAEPVGICGSGLVSAAAAALELGLIGRRGRIADPAERDGERFIALTEKVWLTQSDIRQLQLAKGAMAAGIEILMEKLGAEKLDTILLAGAFGSLLDPGAARRIGLLPAQGRTETVGNAAGSGARRIVCRPELNAEAERLTRTVEFTELAAHPDFAYIFAEKSFFPEEEGEE